MKTPAHPDAPPPEWLYRLHAIGAIWVPVGLGLIGILLYLAGIRPLIDCGWLALPLPIVVGLAGCIMFLATWLVLGILNAVVNLCHSGRKRFGKRTP